MRISSSFFLFLLLISPSVFAFDLEGTVKLEPPHPKPVRLKIDEKYQAECGKEKISSKLIVSPEGGVANAVVKLEATPGTVLPNTSGENQLQKNRPYVLDQINCEFSPHVLLVPQGSEISILNSEAILHNVRAFDEKTEMLFNDAMPRKGQVMKKRFKSPGRHIIRCGVHPWMHALAVVTEHPFYALTDESGHFKIEGIPEGNYTLSVWHETLGELKKEIYPSTDELELVYPAT